MKCCAVFLVFFIAVAAGELHRCEQATYHLAPDAIACMAAFPKYQHNHSTGTCEHFLHDGCTKLSENAFDTKEECEQLCGKWHEEHKGHDHSQHGHEHHH